MYNEWFIAKRLIFSKKTTQTTGNPIVKIATWGIAIGIAVMILAISIVIGFKNEIQYKVMGFGGHIQISNYQASSSVEKQPITENPELVKFTKQIPEIENIQPYAYKLGMLKTKESNQAIQLKGVSKSFDWRFFKKYMVIGDTFIVHENKISKNIIISEYFADLLNLSIGQNVYCYFMADNKTIPRKFTISGIYKTGLDDFDKSISLIDIKHIQRINKWKSDEISGYEIICKNIDDISTVKKNLLNTFGYAIQENGSKYDISSIFELHPDIFQWLDMQNINVWIVLMLMSLVAGFNMISALLILILNRTNMIGILKSFGTTNTSIRSIFLIQAVYLIIKGIVIGNVVGISLCLIQKYTHIITLPVESYFMNYVPINLNFFYLFLLNSSVIIIVLIMLLAPSYIVSKISPVKSIRFN